MPKLIVAAAMVMCSFGVAPASLIVLPANKTLAGGPPAANIMDHKPLVNIPTFGMCITPSNPAVAAATAAALGTPTPAPYVPNTVAPSAPGATGTLIGNMPALHDGCTCNCMWGGCHSGELPGRGHRRCGMNECAPRIGQPDLLSRTRLEAPRWRDDNGIRTG